jgi:hypothetical protein
MLSNAHHFLNRVPPPLQSILATALNQFRLGEMSIHGPAHWLKVLHNATILAEATPGADLNCSLFCTTVNGRMNRSIQDTARVPRRLRGNFTRLGISHSRAGNWNCCAMPPRDMRRV